jgi:uncharacterized delta-60 repeat protein
MWLFASRKPRPRSADRSRRYPYRPRLEALEDRCLLSAGALDPTFGAGAGYLTTALSSGTTDQAKQVLLQPSGNIVVAGATSVPVTTTTKHGTTTTNVSAFGVVTYNADGSLDTAFGSGGIVRQLFAGSSAVLNMTAALEPMGTAGDSKILLAGMDYVGQYRVAMMRLNANGTLDTTFGNNGQVVTLIPTSGTNSVGIAVTSSGQILAVGGVAGSNTVVVARYNPDGSVDSTFGSGGTATTVFSARTYVRGMAQQPDGKFVVACWNQTGTNATGPVYQGMVLRYNVNGSLDTTFGSGGIVTTAIPFGSAPSTRYRGVAVYPNAGTANDGKIIVAGDVSNTPGAPNNEDEYAVVRYNPNGTLDTTFGGGTGYEVISDPKFTYPMEVANAVAIESDGKPILVGDAQPAGGPTYSQVARLNVDGSLDATFGNGGLVATAIGTANTTGGTSSVFQAVAIQPDGRIVAAGYAVVGSPQHDFSLARYLPSQPEIGSFTASANPVAAGGSETLTVSNLTDGNAGSTISQVTFYYYDSSGTKQALGYGTQASAGVWTLAFTVNLAHGNYTLYAQAEDSYGVFGDPLSLSLQVL